MDAPSTVFELHADGADRRSWSPASPTTRRPAGCGLIRAFADLVARLRTIATDADYATDGVVALIAETEGARARSSSDWPWTGLEPADFPQPADDAAIPLPARLLTAAEADEAKAAIGGVPSLTSVRAPDGRTYSLLLRAALPEEQAAG